MEAEPQAMHNKDFAILTIQLGYLNESQKRIEDMIKDFRNDFKNELIIIREELKNVDARHTKNFQSISDYVSSESKVNLSFRVKVAAIAAVISIVGGGLWQLLFIFLK